MASTRNLLLKAPAAALEALTPLAREGFAVEVTAGCSLRATLADDLGLGRECVETRIQTVFMDGSPVDDIDADFARPGSVLALAGALPGVAGIAMQRGSRIGVYREGITHQVEQQSGQQAGQQDCHPVWQDEAASEPARPLRVTLKLFNTVAVECLAQVLRHGVELRAGRLAELLDERPDALAQAEFELDGAPLSRAAVADVLRGAHAPLRLSAQDGTE
ncbi:MAG TPA: hypothetical protein VN419_05050 [Humidesulfovibrio sp.]|uniref:hypothetical protein n=1 Tax=Humidesulfovibrio sp. TaxID=2910988 RepID=UPI002CC1AA2A|nr:hypothetical protein [Humidesulfovibrio sp.]HWR03367.1 hypothetical protein [Humidesulfovibrio sp.]